MEVFKQVITGGIGSMRMLWYSLVNNYLFTHSSSLIRSTNIYGLPPVRVAAIDKDVGVPSLLASMQMLSLKSIRRRRRFYGKKKTHNKQRTA
ncbi:MAG TPA: hypothetical protein VJ692_12410 [Nitrospiraceae bacterium]|nr:hypothetical protein [Nitrospiraceae bacterium]